jgi:glycosyltransferase involved in cell wall biosynthesis
VIDCRFDVVLLTTDYLDSRHGGVESHIYYLGRALRALGHEVQVVRVSDEPARQPVPNDLPLVVLPARRAQLLGPPLSRLAPSPLSRELVRRLLQNLDARVAEQEIRHRFPGTLVHQHDFLGNIRLSRRLARTNPVVWTNHLGEFLLLRRSRWGSRVLPRLTRHYQFVLAPSRELADLPWMAKRVRYCPNGVDAKRFTTASPSQRASIRSRLGWSPDDLVVLVPRRWAPTKGVLVAAQALCRLRNPRSVRAIFIGAGSSEYPSYSAQIERQLRTFDGVVEIVHRLDHLEMVERYQASDVTVIPSFLEATSLAVLEAMACGSPVVASAVGGMPELIRDRETGFLVPPGDPEALARRLEAVAALPHAERNTLSVAARREIETRYSWLAVAEHVATVYRQAVEGKGQSIHA